ncbi:TIGR04222 domain-containing membrane protein [Streptomyces sp. NPDC060194]|uniref:TIGR04222 domain-containing membrane protein n=1 Tax=Streptomyces sp. NPDC060194 TaxID=3347069 RepID=UPI00365A06C9
MLWLWSLPLALAWIATASACFRLCAAAVAASRSVPEEAVRGRALTLPEAAYLSGGPHRVADLALASLAGRGRLLLAHTGWATVVVPEDPADDDVARAALTAVGAGGQAHTPVVRSLTAASPAVAALADRLLAEGLALPSHGRAGAFGAVRSLRRALAGTFLLGLAVELLVHDPEQAPLLLGWVALPFFAGLFALGTARFEMFPYTRWATPLGERLLEDFTARDDLGAIALRGVAAAGDPALRTALAAAPKVH